MSETINRMTNLEVHMQTITTNASNWSGETITVTISDKDTFEFNGYTFSLERTREEVSSMVFELVKAYSPSWPDQVVAVATRTTHLDKPHWNTPEWTAFDGEDITEDTLSRDADSPEKAILKVLANTI